MDSLGYVRAAIRTPSWTIRMRSMLAEFSDFFSQFGHYIAPNYRHDRCDRSVQMRLYTLNKRHFAVIFLMFILGLGLLVIIGILGPPMQERTSVNATSFSSTSFNLQTAGPFRLKSPPTSAFHQQMWLTAHFQLEHAENGKFEFPFVMFVQIAGFADDDEKTQIYGGSGVNHSCVLRCSLPQCDDISVLHLSYLVYPYYVITVQTYGLESLQYKVSDVQFTFITYNASFSQLEIWFRFTFLVLSFIATCVFAYSLRKFSIQNWSMEQKWMTLLLPLLLLFNDPIFALAFLISSWIPGVLDNIFQSTFLSSLLLFWLCLYHGVRQNKRKFVTFYLPKLLLVGVVWISVIALTSWQKYKDLNDPMEQADFLSFKIFTAVSSGLYLLYLLYLMIRAYAELRSMPYFDMRLKFMTALLVLLLTICVTSIVIRSRKNTLDTGFFFLFSTCPINSSEFVILFGLVNLHLFAMAFVYSPSSNALYESHFKDNPALSMLNDSEDEVVYGEEMSLTLKSPRTKYDSDEEAFN